MSSKASGVARAIHAVSVPSIVRLLVVFQWASPAFCSSSFTLIARTSVPPLFPTREEAILGTSDAQILMRLELTYLYLKQITTTTPELEGIRTDLLREIEACKRTLNKIRELDSAVPDYGGLALKAASAGPAVWKMSGRNALPLSKLDQKDQQAIEDLAASALAEIGSAAVTKIRTSYQWSNYREQYKKLQPIWLRLVEYAEQQSSAPRQNSSTPSLRLGVDGSFNQAFQSDLVHFTNCSPYSLDNCLLLVTLKMVSAKGEVAQKQHVHFVENWPRGKSLIARYCGVNSSSIAFDESLQQIHTVTATLYSEQVRDFVSYQYYHTGDYTQDVRQYCAKTTMRARFVPEEYGWLSRDGFGHRHALVRVRLGGGLPRLSPDIIYITLKEAGRTKTIGWPGRVLTTSEATDLASPEMNGFREPKIELSFTFEGSEYNPVYHFPK